MNHELIKVEERDGGEATEITLGPAPANILSAKMMNEISAQLKEEQKNKHKKLIIFSGEGKHFSFGASVEEHKPKQVGNMLPQFHQFIGEVLNCPIPTLAKVSGMCLGGSFEFILACNFIFADEKAKFAVPEIQLAVFPPVASILLPLKIGEAISSQAILTGEQLTAAVLHGHGLVNNVSESGKLDEAVSSFFEKQIQPKSASSLRMANRAGRMLLSALYQEYIGKLETLYLKDLMATQDATEGILSFLEKRKPQWKDE
jgi:cyclohexa-1,5-dienecarbonyl-CoA hydratase